MTQIDILPFTARTILQTLVQHLAALPLDKPVLADLVEPLLHALGETPWPVFYLIATVTARYAHSHMWIVYGLIFLKALLGGH